jgi:hypothetical protein
VKPLFRLSLVGFGKPGSFLDTGERSRVDNLVIVAWWIGAYAIVFGVLLMTLAFRLRALGQRQIPETMLMH